MDSGGNQQNFKEYIVECRLYREIRFVEHCIVMCSVAIIMPFSWYLCYIFFFRLIFFNVVISSLYKQIDSFLCVISTSNLSDESKASSNLFSRTSLLDTSALFHLLTSFSPIDIFQNIKNMLLLFLKKRKTQTIFSYVVSLTYRTYKISRCLNLTYVVISTKIMELQGHWYVHIFHLAR